VGYSRVQTQAALRGADAAKAEAEAVSERMLAQAETSERQQASQVKLIPRSIGGAYAGVLPPESARTVHMAVISNESGRPIRDVACRITPEGRPPSLAAVVGRLMAYNVAPNVVDEVLAHQQKTDRWRLVPARLRCGFVFPFDVAEHPKVRMEARFADDADVHWEIDHDQRVLKLEERDEW